MVLLATVIRCERICIAKVVSKALMYFRDDVGEYEECKHQICDGCDYKFIFGPKKRELNFKLKEVTENGGLTGEFTVN